MILDGVDQRVVAKDGCGVQRGKDGDGASMQQVGFAVAGDGVLMGGASTQMKTMELGSSVRPEQQHKDLVCRVRVDDGLDI